MAKIQHLYQGHGNPNDNPALQLAGGQVGNHFYQDLDNGYEVWISTSYKEGDHVVHTGWERLIIASSLSLYQVESNEPTHEGQLGYSLDGQIYIAMNSPDHDYRPKWRSIGTTLGNWYE